MLILCAFWGLSAACASRGPVTPVGVVSAHVEALRAGQEQRARTWLVSEKRQVMPLPGSEVNGMEGPVELQRRVTWSTHGVGLVHDSSGWRISGGVLELTWAATPQSAARSLARAIKDSDFELLLRLLPAAEQAQWSAAALAKVINEPTIEVAWQALAHALLTEPMQTQVLEKGRRVQIDSGEGVVVLSLEGDGWKVIDVRPHRRFRPSQGTEGM